MPGAPSFRVTWYESRVHYFTTTGPEQAHAAAAQEAAGLGAAAIHSKGTGALAREVAVAKRVGPLHSIAGSGLPYARIENYGGTIQGHPLLYIHGNRVGFAGRTTRSTAGGPIVARVASVQHPAKHYLDVIARAYPQLMVRNLAARLPG